jgi:diguanylate cyclase (GGDEF)-like protein
MEDLRGIAELAAHTPGGSRGTGLWAEFQKVFAEFAGISIQLFDERGRAVGPAPDLPPLCAFLERYPETASSCRKDCLRRMASLSGSRRILSARCFAGLSYRIVPVRRRNRPYGVILVGRVLTEVVGGEQCLGLIEKYKLSRPSFLKRLAATRSLGTADLDRAAALVRRLAGAAIAAEARLESRRAKLERQRQLVAFAKQAAAFAEGGPARERKLLELLGRMLGGGGLALLLPGSGPGNSAVRASVGLGEDHLHALAIHDWQRTLNVHGDGTRAYLAARQTQLGAGVDCADGSLAVRRLESGSATVGHLVVTGADLVPGARAVFDAASDLVAARVVHEVVRARAEQRDEEARLLGLMAERCLSARSVEELLPLALEAAMCSLHARRGSILLAEEQGRVVGRALRGDHAPISQTIDVLQPDSVSHHVFHHRQPLLVRNTDRELSVRRERQFPYATRSFVSVPLRENGHALGVLHLTEREGEGEFTPGDLSLLERLSLQASGAICKARLEEEVRWLRVESATDHLTGLYNRRHLEQRLAEEIQRADRFGQPLTVALLDVDGFKALNDELGHEAGDRTLKWIADTVKSQLRRVDVLARYGGDEFVLLLPGTGAEGGLRIAEKIRARVESAGPPAAAPGPAHRPCTVSVGLCVYPDHAAAGDLLRGADASLLEAKRSGRNTILLQQT